MLTCLVPVLFTFHIQDVLKLKKNNSGAKGLILMEDLGLWSEVHETNIALHLYGASDELYWALGLQKGCAQDRNLTARSYMFAIGCLVHRVTLHRLSWGEIYHPGHNRQNKFAFLCVYYYYRISRLSPLAGKYSPILGCSNQQDYSRWFYM